MIKKVEMTIEKNNLIKSGDKILVGLSGGADSTSLLHVLKKMQEKYDVEIHAVHINHMVRGEEADRDESFSKKLCKDLNVKYHVRRVDMKVLAKKLKITDEEAGRKIRYDAFNEILESEDLNKIAVAHNKNDNAETILVVNAFDRISAPAFIDENNFAGVAWWQDQGVPYKYEYAYTGHQYDFNRQSEWLDDDSPGWGASYADQEARIIKGNSFDNVIVHGQSIMKAGYSFVSVSDEVFENPAYDASAYKAIDVILGEEKTTLSYKGKGPRYKIYTTAFMDKIREVTANHQHVFMSGAYVGSDFMLTNDTIAEKFASEVLHFIWRTNHAVKNGGVYTTDYTKSLVSKEFGFNTGYLPEIYTVEAPDAIEPSGKNVVTAFRYKENNASAGTMYNGDYKTVILGFPFETVETENDRDVLMKDILDFFIKE